MLDGALVELEQTPDAVQGAALGSGRLDLLHDEIRGMAEAVGPWVDQINAALR
jgi:hypothetical protein